MSKFVCAFGIIINTIGTLFTVWTIFATKASYVGTAAEHDNRPNEFPKEKRRVVGGFVLIFAGNALQIVSLFI